MKKLVITLFIVGAAAAVVGSLYAAAGNLVTNISNQFRGSGNLVTKTFEVGDFDGIRAYGVANVTVVKGSGPVTVRTDDNAVPYLEVRVKEGKLRLGLKNNEHEINKFVNVTLEITVPCDGTLSKLKASGASHIVAEPVLTGREIEIDASGASKIVAMVQCTECEIDASGASHVEVGGSMQGCSADASGASSIRLVAQADRCEIDASGASKIYAQGSAEECEIDASGASRIDAEKLTAAACRAEASGSAKITTACTRSLTAKASGASRVEYKDLSDGHLSASISSSGAGHVCTL